MIEKKERTPLAGQVTFQKNTGIKYFRLEEGIYFIQSFPVSFRLTLSLSQGFGLVARPALTFPYREGAYVCAWLAPKGKHSS